MTNKIMSGLALVALLVGCGKAADAGNAAQPSGSPTGANNLPYTVDMAPNVDPKTLPQNTDLKMLDGDVVQYAAQLCHYDSKPEFQPKRCDVFVQADKAGVLLGYVTITQDYKGVWMDSALSLNDPQARGKQGCGISGRLFSGTTGNLLNDAESQGEFRGSIHYQAWEQKPGNWMFAADDGSPDQQEMPEAARGVWYVERKGNNLRVEQERWNYCSKDITVEDVFRRVVTLIKKT